MNLSNLQNNKGIVSFPLDIESGTFAVHTELPKGNDVFI